MSVTLGVLTIGVKACMRPAKLAAITLMVSLLAPNVGGAEDASSGVDQSPHSHRFEASPWFGERIAWLHLERGVRVQINAPNAASSEKHQKRLLIFYALPNGNTIEQTVGKRTWPGEDWHFDIQHIGAQTRLLRQIISDCEVIIAYLENEQKSWPTWRKKFGDEFIPRILTAVRAELSAKPTAIALCGHSGGGSLIFGYLNTVWRIPHEVERIVFLDANYAYEKDRHKEKLAAWLSDSPGHFLCLLAYDDAAAFLNGRAFVTPQGGTWGKSHEMQRDLSQDFVFQCRTNGGFERSSALEGRVQFILKENLERKILHTVLVERNGFIHSMVSGTAKENRGYEYFVRGRETYSRWIQPE